MPFHICLPCIRIRQANIDLTAISWATPLVQMSLVASRTCCKLRRKSACFSPSAWASRVLPSEIISILETYSKLCNAGYAMYDIYAKSSYLQTNSYWCFAVSIWLESLPSRSICIIWLYRLFFVYLFCTIFLMCNN